MEKITGRSDDMLIIRGVNMFPSQIEEMVLKIPTLAPTYQIVVSREGHMDSVEVNVEMRPADDAWLASAPDHLAKELQHSIKTYVGITARVNVLQPNSLERSSVGKARRVIDRRPKA
jgi:phenylacetate-CoA ligase